MSAPASGAPWPACGSRAGRQRRQRGAQRRPWRGGCCPPLAACLQGGREEGRWGAGKAQQAEQQSRAWCGRQTVRERDWQKQRQLCLQPSYLTTSPVVAASSAAAAASLAAAAGGSRALAGRRGMAPQAAAAGNGSCCACCHDRCRGWEVSGCAGGEGTAPTESLHRRLHCRSDSNRRGGGWGATDEAGNISAGRQICWAHTVYNQTHADQQYMHTSATPAPAPAPAARTLPVAAATAPPPPLGAAAFPPPLLAPGSSYHSPAPAAAPASAPGLAIPPLCVHRNWVRFLRPLSRTECTWIGVRNYSRHADRAV